MLISCFLELRREYGSALYAVWALPYDMIGVMFGKGGERTVGVGDKPVEGEIIVSSLLSLALLVLVGGAICE